MLLIGRQLIAIPFGLPLEEIEGAWQPVHRQMFLKVQAGKSIQYLGGLLRVMRSVGHADQIGLS